MRRQATKKQIWETLQKLEKEMEKLYVRPKVKSNFHLELEESMQRTELMAATYALAWVLEPDLYKNPFQCIQDYYDYKKFVPHVDED